MRGLDRILRRQRRALARPDRCQALTRAGDPCCARALPGTTTCRAHAPNARPPVSTHRLLMRVAALQAIEAALHRAQSSPTEKGYDQ
jgi:hypothetical protein